MVPYEKRGDGEAGNEIWNERRRGRGGEEKRRHRKGTSLIGHSKSFLHGESRKGMEQGPLSGERRQKHECVQPGIEWLDEEVQRQLTNHKLVGTETTDRMKI